MVFFRKAEDGFGDEQEEHGDEEGAPDIAGEGWVRGLAGLVELGVAGAFEGLVQLLAGEDFWVVFLGGAVDGEETLAEAKDAGLVGCVGGILGALVIKAGSGFSGQGLGGVAADGGEVGGIEAVCSGSDDALDGGEEDVGIAQI